MFFFKRRTAYEMRISDWSSDVCSSVLGERPAFSFCRPHPLRRHGVDLKRGNVLMSVILFSAAAAAAAASAGMEPVITVTAGREQELSSAADALTVLEIGTASGRERVCHSV